MPSQHLVTAENREAIAGLQFFARSVVDGLNAGRHRSPARGSSVEFKEHREYVRGDEIKSIDWKLYGKTDRLFIRQYEDETNLQSTILLDQSGSMGYAGKRFDSISKHQYGTQLAACLATLLISQQDAVGVATLDTVLRDTVPPRSNISHLQKLVATLVNSRPGGETSLADAIQQAAGKLKRRGLLILISDCFDAVDKFVSALSAFRRSGHEVIVFQVWDQDELDFRFQNRTEFRSLEDSRRHLIDPLALREAYLRRVREFREQLNSELAKQRIELVECTTNQSCGDVLADFLASRRRGKQAARKGGKPSDKLAVQRSERKAQE